MSKIMSKKDLETIFNLHNKGATDQQILDAVNNPEPEDRDYIHNLAFNAIQEAIRYVQSEIGVTDGMYASMFFTGAGIEEVMDDFKEILEAYAESELDLKVGEK